MGDIVEKDSSQTVKVVGSDTSGNETVYLEVNENSRAKTSQRIESANQAIVNVTGANVEAYVNLLNTVGGNLAGREGVRIFNRGGKIRWRILGDLTGNDGEDIGKNESVEFPYGEDIVLQVRERNSSNEIDIIITEFK